MAHFETGDYEEAINSYKKAITFEPCATYHINLALAYQKERNKQNTKLNFEQAIELDPNCTEAYFNLGNLYFNWSE